MELESATEHAHETIHEHVAEPHGGRSTPRWHIYVALSTLVMALLSAMAALMAALSAHEALLERTQEIVDFVALETDRIEIEVLRSKHDILRQFEVTPPPDELSRIRTYQKEVAILMETTAEEEAVVRASNRAHIVFAIAVTLLSVGITLGGMSLIAEQRFLWIVGLVFGVAGTLGVVIGFRTMIG
jgi:Flp pilus assembly protein TadB